MGELIEIFINFHHLFSHFVKRHIKKTRLLMHFYWLTWFVHSNNYRCKLVKMGERKYNEYICHKHLCFLLKRWVQVSIYRKRKGQSSQLSPYTYLQVRISKIIKQKIGQLIKNVPKSLSLHIWPDMIVYLYGDT